MRPIITVKNLSKQYRLGASQASHRTLRESLVETARAPLRLFSRNGGAQGEVFWALKDVSFEVMPGEVLGFIGRNGAGKSTLLKILSRVTEPTTGRVELFGRVGSLLEVGTGFHPELTGRENVFLNGSILGMHKAEIDAKFDEIVAFSEIERFIDTPVKRYSSGMYVRLAFAVSAHLESEILIVDEVLAVGDTQFQKKCLNKILEVSAEGRTVLFVSHNMGALTQLCNECVLLEKGQFAVKGQPQEVIKKYLRTENTSAEWQNEAPPTAPTQLTRAAILDGAGRRRELLNLNESFRVSFTLQNALEAKVFPNVHVKNQLGETIFCSAVNHDGRGAVLRHGGYLFECEVPKFLLRPGIYTITIALSELPQIVHQHYEGILSFEIADTGEIRGDYMYDWPGVVWPRLEWRVTEL